MASKPGREMHCLCPASLREPIVSRALLEKEGWNSDQSQRPPQDSVRELTRPEPWFRAHRKVQTEYPIKPIAGRGCRYTKTVGEGSFIIVAYVNHFEVPIPELGTSPPLEILKFLIVSV